MKYSYMPTKNYQGLFTVNDEVNKGYDYFIDSDERVLVFRNQYKEIFIFTSRKALIWLLGVSLIIGIMIGKLI